MQELLIETAIISTIAGLIVAILIPIYIKMAKNHQFVGIDRYKYGNVKVAESGGLVLLLGYIFIHVLSLISYPQYAIEFLTVFVIISTTALIGLQDDFFNLTWNKKIIFAMFASLPLIIYSPSTFISLPFIGGIEFGWIYLLLLPIAVTGCCNAINMVAGYNGLETGMGLIMFTALTLIGIITQNYIVILLSLPFAFMLYAFLLYNKYPSRIFLGDTGTFLIGGMLACTVIIGKIEFIGVCLLIPYFFNLFIYFYGYIKLGSKKVKSQRFGSIDKDGYITVPHKYYLPWLVTTFAKTTEKKAVYILCLIEIIVVLFIFMFLV